jgi:CRISPR-associated protein Cas5h
MLKVVSFEASGEFAAFRDPSVTSNQTVYYIPSKTSVIGMIGAILGVERGHRFAHKAEENYNTYYRQLYAKTRIGIEYEAIPEKVSFFTNHRSLKEAKTKPFKTELVRKPKYRIFVNSDDETVRKIYDAVSSANYVYPPYLGQAYCPAILSDAEMNEASEIKNRKFKSSCTVLDETSNRKFELKAFPCTENESDKSNSLIIERHLFHHFTPNGELEARVLKHWIPVGGSLFEFEMEELPEFSIIARLQDDRNVCLY